MSIPDCRRLGGICYCTNSKFALCDKPLTFYNEQGVDLVKSLPKDVPIVIGADGYRRVTMTLKQLRQFVENMNATKESK